MNFHCLVVLCSHLIYYPVQMYCRLEFIRILCLCELNADRKMSMHPSFVVLIEVAYKIL